MSGKSIVSIRDRFDRRVVRSSDPSGCWLWTGCANNKGYGIFGVAGRNRLAHRTAYEFARGEIGAGLVVRHKCDVPRCVNPAHLETGTMKDNTADMMSRGRDGHGSVRGSAHPGSKLSEPDVALIKLLLDCGVRNIRMARLYGVSDTKIAHIKSGKSWSHVSPLEASC